MWADVALHGGGSLLGPLEVTLDALEPVLGRDPRGRDWQEFFPNDHVIGWLRVRACHARAGAAPGPSGRCAASPARNRKGRALQRRMQVQRLDEDRSNSCACCAVTPR